MTVAGIQLILAQGGQEGRIVPRMEWLAAPHGRWAAVALALGLAAVAGVFWLYRRERAATWPAARYVCLALRLLCLAGVGLVLMQPAVARDVERVQFGRTVVLADRSASMSVRDAVWPDGLAEAWARVLGLPDGESLRQLRRHDVVRAVLTGPQEALLERLGKANRVELMAFDTRPAGVFELEPEGARRPVPFDIPEWEPTGPGTDVAAAVRQALAGGQGRQGQLMGIVILTDGRQTEPTDLWAAASEAASRGVPLHFIGIGSPLAAPNIAVVDLDGPDSAQLGLPMRMRLLLRADGYEGRTAEVVLTAASPPEAEPREVLRRRVSLAGLGAVQQIDLGHEPFQAGIVRYRAWVEPMEGEGRLDDNAAWRDVDVSEEKLQVLLIAGTPSLEYRFLRALIERDPSFALTALLSAAEGAGQGAELPEKEVLDGYDVVLLCDPCPADLRGERVAELLDLVDRDGLGLIFVAGPTYSAALLSGQDSEAWNRVLPVTVDRMRAAGMAGSTRHYTEPMAVKLDAAGRDHPVTRMGERDGAGGDLWSDGLSVYWVLPTAGAKAGATVLLRAVPVGATEGFVLAAAQPYGLGRVLYCGTAETWRWRRQGVELYARFWLQALRYCASGRAEGRAGRPALMLDRYAYVPGQPVQVRARLVDAASRPLREPVVRLDLVRDGQRVGEVELRPTSEEKGFYEGILYPQEFGRFELVFAAPGGAHARCAFDVRLPDVELQDTRMMESVMRQIAQVTGGRFYEPEQIGQVVAAIPDGRRIVVETGPLKPLWDRSWALAAMLAALAAEWLLRKRMGLL